MKNSPVPIDRNLSHTLDVVRFLFEPGEVIEIRGIGVGRTASFAGCITSGYFNLENTPAILQAIRKLDGHAEGVYIVLNKLNPDLLARANNRLQARPKNTTSDQDILERRWLYIDADSIRPSGISATEAEHDAALARTKEISAFLTDAGWPEGFRADSGNGGHLLYRLPLLDPVKADDLVRRCLQALNAQFSDDKVLIDVSTANRARIIKLYGTLTKKGDDTPARPHRRAMGLQGPERAEPVPVELLEQLAAQVPEAIKPKQNEGGDRPTAKSSFDIDAWLAKSSLEIASGPDPYSGGRRWLLRSCPFATDKPHDKPAVLQLASGALVYRCLHKSCEANNWEALRNLVEPNRSRGTQTQPGVRPAQQEEGTPAAPKAIEFFSVSQLLALQAPPPTMLVEDLIPNGGACLIVGASKAGKTILASQLAIGVAAKHAIFDYYNVVKGGPVLLVEQDDPAATSSVKDILVKSPVPVGDIPFTLVPKIPFGFDDSLINWLRDQISQKDLRLVVLDSYTRLRRYRASGADIVKAEADDMALLDELAKEAGITIAVLHHVSNSGLVRDWMDQSAGTFALGAAVESLMHVSRFKELDSNANERLIRVRGRHFQGTELVLQFRPKSLDYEHILESAAAAELYPLTIQLKHLFGAKPFTPKQLIDETGVSRATAHRQITRLHRANVISKRGYGEYALS